MTIEKTVVDGNRYDVDKNDYVAEGELTVTITLGEYRELIKKSVENKLRELSDLYRKFAENSDLTEEQNNDEQK